MGELFSMDDILPPKQEDQNARPAVGYSFGQGYKLGKNKTTIAQLLPQLEKNKVWHIPSMGSFSTHLAIDHVLSLTGPAEVLVTSWAISEEAIKSLLKGLGNGSIISLECLFDERVKTYAPNAWQIASHNLAHIGLGKCHAKIVVIQNQDWQITINGSANLSVNRRIESYVFTENKDVSNFYKQWIKELINGANPFLT